MEAGLEEMKQQLEVHTENALFCINKPPFEQV
jgi:hypothetical protein